MSKSIERRKRQIRRIAYKVRMAVDNLAASEGREPGGCLWGYCARASAMLSYELKKAKIKHRIAYGDGHVYILWRGHVVDITATQFGRYGNAIIRKTSHMSKRNEAWKTSVVFSSIEDIKKWQIKLDCWPEQQIIKEKDLSYL